MSAPSSSRLLGELEACRYRFGSREAAHVAKLLVTARSLALTDSASLIRFHEVLLVLRAFPPSARVLRQCESLLNTFWRRVAYLRAAGADMNEFDPLEVSGIAGTVMQDTLSFDLMRWLVRSSGLKLEIAWADYDDERAMGAVWPRIIPLLEEDTLVEANIPWERWLHAAQASTKKDPAWLVERFAALSLPDADKAQLYDSLRMPVRWKLENSRVSRTRNWRSVRSVFYHKEPLITRREVSLADELAKLPPRLKQLSTAAGQAVMDLIRKVMLVRYRELYGTTVGDPTSVVQADVGRGVTIYLWNLPPERRLPLRAYAAGMTVKNGVPINYVEAMGLFEWMEVGFNTFYTYRGGEVAWIFAQVMRCLCHLMGTTCISMYPYQLGHHNEEAIESGAFWFYRKLGFRPGRKDLLRLAEREEARTARDPEHRSSKRTLCRLAEGHVFYELPGSPVGAWDRFSVRNIGVRVNQHMAENFAGNLEAFRNAAVEALARNLRQSMHGQHGPAKRAAENFAMALSLVPELRSWSSSERGLLIDIVRAKSGRDEMRYLHLLQQHDKLRRAMLRLGSGA
jgi:hypothetical protein